MKQNQFSHARQGLWQVICHVCRDILYSINFIKYEGSLKITDNNLKRGLFPGSIISRDEIINSVTLLEKSWKPPQKSATLYSNSALSLQWCKIPAQEMLVYLGRITSESPSFLLQGAGLEHRVSAEIQNFKNAYRKKKLSLWNTELREKVSSSDQVIEQKTLIQFCTCLFQSSSQSKGPRNQEGQSYPTLSSLWSCGHPMARRSMQSLSVLLLDGRQHVRKLHTCQKEADYLWANTSAPSTSKP